MIDYREDAKWTVYVHIVPKELSGYDGDKYYVGITSQKVEERWGSNGSRYKSNQYFKNAIKKYTWHNIVHEIIAEHLTYEEACGMEKSLIKALQSNNKTYGYNMTSGGEGVCDREPWNKGGHLYEETKQKLSEKLKGRYINDEWKKNIGNAVKKRWEPGGDLRNRMSGENSPVYGKPGYWKDKRGFDNVHSKPVICLNTLEVYGSSSEAEEITGAANFSSICACCRGDKYAVGIDTYKIPMVWMLYDDYKQMSRQEICNYIYDRLIKTKYKPVININTMELFSSPKIAAFHYGNSNDPSYFVRSVKANKLVYGFKWKYFVDYLQENNMTIVEARQSLFFVD